jgi:osmotically-inducible protein OsmY
MMSILLSTRHVGSDTVDDQLARRIQRQLAADSRAVSRLQIKVDEGVVTLRGVATSFYQKQLWLHGTKQVVGDRALIHDEIAVTSSWEDTDFGWRD